VANCTTSRRETLEEDIVVAENKGAALLLADSDVAVLPLRERLPCDMSNCESDAESDDEGERD
jgi:hypothetical protein